MPILAQEPLLSLLGLLITTPSLYKNHSLALKWCGESIGFIRPANLSAGECGKSALLRYYGVSKYSKFWTKNSVVVKSCIIFICLVLSQDNITTSLKQKIAAAFAICPTRYVLSSRDYALSTIEDGTTNVRVYFLLRYCIVGVGLALGWVSTNFLFTS